VNTIPATTSKTTASAILPPDWLFRLRSAKGYSLAVRVLGGGWFLLLATAVAGPTVRHLQVMSLADFSPTGWPKLLSSVLLVLFYVAACWLILLRPSPVARTDGLLPSLVAFAGTYFPWTIVLFTPGEASAGQDIASAVLLLVGTLLMVVVIAHLGRAFSIVPQARTLVRTGPYAFVRNPLYLAEEIALLGSLLQFYSLVTLIMILVHGALQVGRIFYEESLLRRTFPDYESYARSTSRLIPFVW
jgi:protein-S-isoprenylcysteine O-methyltransferase Ste14